MKKTTLYLIPILLHTLSITPATIQLDTTPLTPAVTQAALVFTLEEHEYLYKNHIDISIDSPNITVGALHTKQEAHDYYQPHLKESRSAYTDHVTFVTQLTRAHTLYPETAHMHISFYTSAATCPQEQIIPITFAGTESKETEKKQIGTVAPEQKEHKKLLGYEEKKDFFSTFSPSAYVTNLVTTTDNIWIRLLLVCLLGMLVSLTPCIYPMIPITIGILHAQGSGSLAGNLARSVSYTMGIATTFACFGLLASCMGPIYGYLLGNPFFVIPLTFFLAYLALSMFGFYDIYIPRFMQTHTNKRSTGSILSAFVFGAASGTISSPCALPGLTLLLGIAATYTNPFMGFLLLFVFGFGTSMPLLIIGTFSSSMNLFPRAGTWMVEVKKIFGSLLLAMCVYYLNNILPWHITLWLMAGLSGICGLMYLYGSVKTTSSFWKKLDTIIGIACIIGAMVGSMYAYQATTGNEHTADSVWLTDYQKATMIAHAQHKYILLDFGASFCSICKEIDRTILRDPAVLRALDMVVPLKVDGTNPQNQPYAQLQEEFHVTAFPTLLLINPETKEIVHRWASELYCTGAYMFAQELSDAASAYK